MPYIALQIADTKVNAAISMFTEGYLEQAHYLLAADRPHGGLAKSAVVMTLLAISSASRIRIFDPIKNDKKKGSRDGDAFISCVRTFFPWECVSVEDDQYRTASAVRDAAALELYKVFCCVAGPGRDGPCQPSSTSVWTFLHQRLATFRSCCRASSRAMNKSSRSQSREKRGRSLNRFRRKRP